MTTVAGYFEQAQLSLAAYASLKQGMLGADNADYVAALREGGMSQAQAEVSASTYRVIAQSPESGFFGTGFGATLFQNQESGTIHIAIRGSEADLNDWIATNLGDIGADGIAVRQGIELFNWLQRLFGSEGTPVVQYIYNPNTLGSPSLTVASAIGTGELARLADFLHGGLGNDYLEGGHGEDFYHYHPSDGANTVVDQHGFRVAWRGGQQHSPGGYLHDPRNPRF